MRTRYNNLQPVFSSLVNDVLNSGLSAIEYKEKTSIPAVNVTESETAYSLEVIAPGLEKSDFKLQVEDNQLKIAYQHEKETTEGETKEKFIKREFSLKSFERVFKLPKTVNTEEISASYKQGILSINLPKQEEVKTKLEIDIN